MDDDMEEREEGLGSAALRAAKWAEACSPYSSFESASWAQEQKREHTGTCFEQ
jgi:hypothetical protein